MLRHVHIQTVNCQSNVAAKRLKLIVPRQNYPFIIQQFKKWRKLKQ
uniref:Uncharacterized protein n=1 Tax=Anguilla anguilla TaxID=7936 RepID=A0A0E9T1I4_ANGAN